VGRLSRCLHMWMQGLAYFERRFDCNIRGLRISDWNVIGAF
jgi:hypothetical protein